MFTHVDLLQYFNPISSKNIALCRLHFTAKNNISIEINSVVQTLGQVTYCQSLEYFLILFR